MTVSVVKRFHAKQFRTIPAFIYLLVLSKARSIMDSEEQLRLLRSHIEVLSYLQ